MNGGELPALALAIARFDLTCFASLLLFNIPNLNREGESVCLALVLGSKTQTDPTKKKKL